MSIKLYKGFRIKTDSMKEVLNIVEKFRPIIELEAQKIMDTFLNNVKESYNGDKESLECKVAAHSLWFNARKKILDEGGKRMPSIDTDFSITLYPYNGYLLGTVFTEHTAWYELWCQQDQIEEYAYWNNMDKPNNISEENWNQRQIDWNMLSNNPLSMQGFSMDVIDPHGPKPLFLRK